MPSTLHRYESLAARAACYAAAFSLHLMLGACCRVEPETPLAMAAAADDVSAVRALAAAGAPLEAEDRFGHTPLLWACRHGATAAALALLDLGAQLEHADGRQGFGWTPLVTAIHTGHLGTARALLARGADVNARGSNGTSPLLMAIADAPSGDDRAAFVRELLEAGADPRAALDSGMNALGLAAAGGDEEVLRLVRAYAPDLLLPQTLAGAAAGVVAMLRGHGDALEGEPPEAGR